MILKLLGLFLISFAGAMLGFGASLRLKSRVQFLEKYITLLKETRTRIRLSACDIRELFKGNTGCKPLDIMTADFTDRVKDGESVKDAWLAAVGDSCDNHGAPRLDRELIAEFGKEFGQSDIDGEINHIDIHISLVEDRLDQARFELTQKGRLYRTLGLFGGITVSLIIL